MLNHNQFEECFVTLATLTIYQITVLAFLNILYPFFMVLIIYAIKSLQRNKLVRKKLSILPTFHRVNLFFVYTQCEQIRLLSFGETLDHVNVKSRLCLNVAGAMMERLYGLNLLFQAMWKTYYSSIKIFLYIFTICIILFS